MKKRLSIISLVLLIAGVMYLGNYITAEYFTASKAADGMAEEAFADLRVKAVGETEYLAPTQAEYENIKTTMASQMQESAQNGGSTMKVSFQCAESELTEWAQSLYSAYSNAIYDYPEEMYYAAPGLSWRISGSGSTYTATITPRLYADIQNDADTYHEAVDRACLECFGSAHPSGSSMTALEKVTAAHDWLVATCRYDPYVGNAGSASSWKAPDGTVYYPDSTAYTSYGAFVKHNAVCQGYALAFKVLMDRAGVPCAYASSAQMSHAWDVVQINGRWYHVDCTWDDPSYNGLYDYAGHVSRTYFLQSDSEMTAKKHYGWTTEYNYTCPSSFPFPSALSRASEMPSVRDGNLIYVISTDNVLHVYREGSGFASEVKTISLNLMPYTAVYDYDSHQMYIGTYSDIYKVNPQNGTIEKFGSFSQPGSGLYLRANGDGTAALTTSYGYQTRQSWTVGEKKGSQPSGYVVTFDPQGGTVTPQTKTITAYSPLGELPVPVRSGYNFAGWFTAANGGTQMTSGNTISANTTLYAHWTVQVHTHQWNAGVVTKAATCTEAGVRTYTCSNCGETKTETIPATGHQWNAGVVTKAATCTEAGVRTYTCSNCGETKTETIPATGHQWNAGVVTKEATCTEAGVRTYTCSNCGETKTETIPATGHQWNAGVVTKEATCTEAGVRTYTCSNCGETRTETIPAVGHQWDDGVVTKAATCTEEGIRTFTCSHCGETKTETIPVTEHHWNDGVVTKAATCTEDGERTATCAVCGETVTETIPATEHHWDDGVVTEEPSCTEEGKRTYTCSHCGETRTEVLPAGSHQWDAGVITKAATCTEAGIRTFTCSHCGETKTESIPATGHHFENGVCTVCGEEDSDEQAANELVSRFTDVKETDYFYRAVRWAVMKKITLGTSATTFSPNSPCTRGQVVTFLWRADGMPEPKTSNNPFRDVDSSAYYYKAVLWAVEQGITTGAGDGIFAPDASCERGHIVTFLWRYAGKPAAQFEAGFTDVAANAYYAQAVYWAKNNGITTGTSSTTFSPSSTCTRGQVVTFLYRYMGA